MHEESAGHCCLQITLCSITYAHRRRQKHAAAALCRLELHMQSGLSDPLLLGRLVTTPSPCGGYHLSVLLKRLRDPVNNAYNTMLASPLIASAGSPRVNHNPSGFMIGFWASASLTCLHLLRALIPHAFIVITARVITTYRQGSCRVLDFA